MNNVQVSVFARTDIGMQRSGNEDSFLVADLTTGNVGLGPDMSTHAIGERGSLMVVSDGMGGAVAGEIASEMAVNTIRDSLMEMPGDLTIAERLRLATEIANERIWSHAQQNPELSGMGATLTAVLAHQTIAYIAQVGDSRAYLMRGDQIKQVTKDQSLVQMLIDSGAIEPEQASSVPQNVIMQALGTQPSVKVAMTAVEVCRNDFLLVCSDGLSNKISPKEMQQTIQETDDLTAACRQLVEMANERGGEDNITVIIARFDGEALHSASESTSITGSFLALNQEYLEKTGDQTSSITSQFGTPLSSTPTPPADVTTMVMPAFTLPIQSEQTDNDGSEAGQAAGTDKPTERLDARGEAITDERPAFPTSEEKATSLPEGEAAADEEPPGPAPEIAKPVTVTTTPMAGRKKSYTAIWIAALLSLALLAAGLYAGYIWYMRQPVEQQNVEPENRTEPGADQQDGQPQPGETKPEEKQSPDTGQQGASTPN
ncbi:MAG TPA: Stp1/IreP family PP2C-type Ser/Thr phosphatase [Blastocatellia bacterium]|nr:Stp1/IreP family PP2C-type Ser/Thr phosphatase [Blastocatellia bacterium]